MKPGDIVLARVPQGAVVDTKPRPSLVLAILPGVEPTILICGLSTRLDVRVDGWDVLIDEGSSDFIQTGLHRPSMIRPSWLATLRAHGIERLGSLSPETFGIVRDRIIGVLASGGES